VKEGELIEMHMGKEVSNVDKMKSVCEKTRQDISPAPSISESLSAL
jgi:hypothetical protein